MRVKQARSIEPISTEWSLEKLLKHKIKNESHKEILQCKLKIPI